MFGEWFPTLVCFLNWFRLSFGDELVLTQMSREAGSDLD